MKGSSVVKSFCAITCIMVLFASISGAPSLYSDYDNGIRDLWDMLLQREALEEKFGNHQMVRKSERSPSLRLRFGKRENMLPDSAYWLAQEATEHGN